MEFNKQLHIISLNIPYPANYGGVIDIFYKIKALHDCGVSVILHCFEYNRQPAAALEDICQSVFYYKRSLSFFDLFSKTPFIVKTRSNDQLLNNLLTNQAPILFEGLHCTTYLNHPKLANRLKLVRTHNIEHDYYKHLAYAENNWLKKAFYKLESIKLRKFEPILRHANYLLAISLADSKYFKQHYGKSIYLPAFNESNTIETKEGIGEYILMHGNLEVKENEISIIYLIKNVLQQLSYQVIIAGKEPSRKLKNIISRHPNISLIPSPSNEQMNDLIKNAQIILLHTFQATGMKLKLLNSLVKGRYLICNANMIENTGLESLCFCAESNDQWISIINMLMSRPISKNEIVNRQQIFQSQFDNSKNIQIIIELLNIKTIC